jgi:Transposase DDE domain/Transposase domain (DUF772)
MSIVPWRPRAEYSRKELVIVKRIGQTRKLFVFLRAHRMEIFNDAFQHELASMYRDSGAGKEPIAPAFLAMVCLLQAYMRTSDAEAVQLSVLDARWQLVLGTLTAEDACFSQGALADFRQRIIRTGLDQRLLARTVEIAMQAGTFDPRKLPKDIRIAVDSAPLEGAGRVEDTLNLLGHAARKIVMCAATLLNTSVEEVATAAGIPVLLAPSIKRGLDREWGPAGAMRDAVAVMVKQLDALEKWLQKHLRTELTRPPLQPLLKTLHQLRKQDLEPDPSGGGMRIREEHVPNRRISIEDPDMRHGRKSKSLGIKGYKQHVAIDLDTNLIVACTVAPANQPEQLSLAPLVEQMAVAKRTISELYIDRGYIASAQIDVLQHAGANIFCKPWVARNDNGRFVKSDFTFDLRSKTVACPAGEIRPIILGIKTKFGPTTCGACKLREQCTTDARNGRQVSVAIDEPLQKKLRMLVATRSGRDLLRRRVPVEHRLAHLTRRQGRRARYRGTRNNLFDLRRTAAIENLIVLHRQEFLNAA